MFSFGRKNKDQAAEVTVSNRTVVRVLLIIIFTFLVLQVLNNARHALELIFLASFMALALNPAVSWIARNLRIKTRALAVGIAYLAVVVVLGTFISLVVPPLVRQTADFVRNAPQTISSLNDENSSLGRLVVKYNLQDQVNGFSQDVKNRTKNLQKPVISTASRVGSAMISILTVFVLTFMMLTEGPEWIDRYWSLHPKHRREHDRELVARMYGIVTGYVNGQVLLALLGALLGLVALLIASTLLNVSVNALALAGIMFVTGLIPMIGHLIGAAIVVVACLFVSWPLALIMAIFIFVHQQIENVTLQPYIQAKFNELTPLLVFVAALLGIGFGGLIGAFVAIPAAGCAKILFTDYLATRKVEDPTD